MASKNFSGSLAPPRSRSSNRKVSFAEPTGRATGENRRNIRRASGLVKGAHRESDLVPAVLVDPGNGTRVTP
jgi:hypothetical protein